MTTRIREAATITAAPTDLPPLPPAMALWRIERLPLAELKTRLQAAGLRTDGLKRTVAKRLWDHLQTLPRPSTAPSESGERTSNDRDTTAGPESAADGRRRSSRRRSHSGSPLTARDLRAVKHLLRHRPSRRRSASGSTTSTSPTSRSSSSSPRASYSNSSEANSRRPTPSPRRSHTRRQHRSHRTEGHHHRRSYRRRGRHSKRHWHRESLKERHQTGLLPPIPDRIKGRIRRGEYIELYELLQVNLTIASRRKRRHSNAADKTPQRASDIVDFESWIEAWSVYASALTSYYPHLAPRLFQYQHFITLKSRTFQTKAWLRYDTEFRLKLAANGSWHFEAVDTELWASCFAADGLTAAQAPTLACFTCGSTTHLYAACPQRRPHSNFRPPLGQNTPRPPATSGGDHPNSSTRDQQEPCFIFNDKGRCFRGHRCPYAHTCTHCGGQHPKRACPNLRT